MDDRRAPCLVQHVTEGVLVIVAIIIVVYYHCCILLDI